MRQYTITISEVLNWNGINCSPSKTEITFESTGCANITCDKGKGIITVEIPDGCEEKCFYGIVTCTEECDGCGDREIKICPCDSSVDCGPCEKCLTERSVCVSKCGPGEICSDECGGCAECDSEHPCTGGKVCSGCKCVCPPDAPYTNENGQCSNCSVDGHCPPCHKCTPEGCRPIVCSVGVCDPETRDCVECLSRTDCTKPNECCSDGKKCVCCPGFVRDRDGNCVPEGCKNDGDCGSCETCDVPTGKCKPLICPPGEVCVPGLGCKPICDCNNPLCDNQSPCIRLNETVCYCSGCSGSCADGKPCGPGCYCDKTDMKCKPNPCKGSCDNGTECGPGCGCNPATKQCEPCNSRDCATCPDLLGCGCQDFVNCSDLPDCGNECSTGAQCPPNCGCYKGKCVRCENFSCTDCEKVDGCVCPDGKCVSDNNRDCEDNAVITKNNENCSITAYFDIKSPCQCSVIMAGAGHTGFDTLNGVLRTSMSVVLKKGIATDRTGFNALPELDILPESGAIKLVSYAVYKEGTVIKPRVKVDEISLSASGTDALFFNNLQLGSLVSGASSLYRYEIEIFLSSKLKFSNNCEYDTKRIAYIQGLSDLSSPSVNGFFISELTSESVRNPIVTWYRALPGQPYTAPFRKAYIGKGADGKYFDTLFGPAPFTNTLDNWPLQTPEGLLFQGYSYKASTDCACEDATINDVTFCNLDKFQYTLTETNCKKTLVLSANFNACPINTVGYDMPVNSKTKFFLYLNGVLVYEWEGSLNQGWQHTIEDTITDVRIVQKAGDRVVCERSYTHTNDLILPVVNVECSVPNNPTILRVTVNQVSSNSINKIEFGLNDGTAITYPGSLAAYNHMGSFTAPVVKDIDKSLLGTSVLVARFTYANGCSKVMELPKCNVDGFVEFSPNNISYASCTPIGGKPSVIVTAVGFGPNVMYSLDNGPLQSSNTFVNVSAGLHTVRITDGESEKILNVEVLPAVVPNVYFTNPSICVGGTTKLVIEAPNGSVFNIQTPTATLTNVTVVGSKYELAISYNANVGGNYVVTLVSNNGQACNGFQKTIQLTVGGEALDPVIEFMPGSYCVGQPVPFRIVGGNGNTFSVSSNGTGTVSPENVVASNTQYNGMFTPNTTSAQLQITGFAPGSGGDCNTTTMNVFTITVNQTPSVLSVNSVCNTDNTHTVTVTVSDATSVTIANVAATNVSPGVWQRANVSGLSGTINIVAVNSNCTTTVTHELQNCSCPEGTLIIEGDGNICGAGQVIFDYSVFHNQAPTASWNFVWQTFISGVWTDAGAQAAYDSLNPPQFVYHLNTNQSVTARLKMTNTVNGCVYYSNELTQMSYPAAAEPTISMSPNPALVGNPVTFTAPAGYASYQWKINGVNVGTNQNTYTYTPTVSGSVTVRVDVVNNNGCTAFKQTNFTIGANCPDVPIVYVPGSACSDSLRFVVTNNIGVINYAYTGTGDNATVLSGSGVVPGNNEILVPIGTLDPNETIGIITFTFTYTQGANPECEIIKEVTVSYLHCYNDLTVDLADLTAAAGEYLFLTDGRFYPCGTPDSNEIAFWSNSGNGNGNGNQEFMLDNNTACTDQQVVDGHFGEAPGTRTLVASIGDLATAMQAAIQLKAGLSGVTVSGVGTVLTFSNVPCRLVSRVMVIAYKGTMNGTCDGYDSFTSHNLVDNCSC